MVNVECFGQLGDRRSLERLIFILCLSGYLSLIYICYCWYIGFCLNVLLILESIWLVIFILCCAFLNAKFIVIANIVHLISWVLQAKSVILCSIKVRLTMSLVGNIHRRYNIRPIFPLIFRITLTTYLLGSLIGIIILRNTCVKILLSGNETILVVLIEFFWYFLILVVWVVCEFIDHFIICYGMVVYWDVVVWVWCRNTCMRLNLYVIIQVISRYVIFRVLLPVTTGDFSRAVICLFQIGQVKVLVMILDTPQVIWFHRTHILIVFMSFFLLRFYFFNSFWINTLKFWSMRYRTICFGNHRRFSKDGIV